MSCLVFNIFLLENVMSTCHHLGYITSILFCDLLGGVNNLILLIAGFHMTSAGGQMLILGIVLIIVVGMSYVGIVHYFI